MDAHVIRQFADQWLGLIFDAGLIFGFLLLWLSWFRNGKRQQRLEQLLLNTSSQLEEATRHLSQASEAIKHLKQYEQRTHVGGNPMKEIITTKPQQTIRTKSISPPTSTLPTQNSTQATMILRMQREGEPPQTIAERLDMPLAQVKLLLKLHAASSAVD